MKTNDMDSDTYAEGMDAAHKGQSAATCPYAYDSVDGAKWLEGFQDAVDVVLAASWRADDTTKEKA